MEIKTKYKIGDVVYFIQDTNIKTMTIHMIVVNDKNEIRYWGSSESPTDSQAECNLFGAATDAEKFLKNKIECHLKEIVEVFNNDDWVGDASIVNRFMEIQKYCHLANKKYKIEIIED